MMSAGRIVHSSLWPAALATSNVGPTLPFWELLYEAWGKPDQATAWKAKVGMPDLPADVFAARRAGSLIG